MYPVRFAGLRRITQSRRSDPNTPWKTRSHTCGPVAYINSNDILVASQVANHTHWMSAVLVLPNLVLSIYCPPFIIDFREAIHAAFVQGFKNRNQTARRLDVARFMAQRREQKPSAPPLQQGTFSVYQSSRAGHSMPFTSQCHMQ